MDPLGSDLNTGDLEKNGLYVEENPPCLVAIGRLSEGFTTSIWEMIKPRMVLRKLERQVLTFLYPLERFS